MGKGDRIGLRLYMVKGARNSQLALQRMQALCDAHVSGHYDLELVDIAESPERLVADGVLVTPTLVKHRPFPIVRIIGTLEDSERVLKAIKAGGSRS